MGRSPIPIRLLASLLVALACQRPSERAAAPGPVDSLLAELADSYPPDAPLGPYLKGNLGGLNVWAYCLSEGYPATGYAKGIIEGEGAAIDNWACQRGADQLAPIEPRLIDMTEACRWQYGRRDVIGRAADPNHAWSWSCLGQ